MLSISFSPLVPDYALWILGAAVALLAILALVSRGPVAIVRALALALVLLALANPSLVQEDRGARPSLCRQSTPAPVSSQPCRDRCAFGSSGGSGTVRLPRGSLLMRAP